MPNLLPIIEEENEIVQCCFRGFWHHDHVRSRVLDDDGWERQHQLSVHFPPIWLCSATSSLPGPFLASNQHEIGQISGITVFQQIVKDLLEAVIVEDRSVAEITNNYSWIHLGKTRHNDWHEENTLLLSGSDHSAAIRSLSVCFLVWHITVYCLWPSPTSTSHITHHIWRFKRLHRVTGWIRDKHRQEQEEPQEIVFHHIKGVRVLSAQVLGCVSSARVLNSVGWLLGPLLRSMEGFRGQG